MGQQEQENSIIEYMLTLLHVSDGGSRIGKQKDAKLTGKDLMYLETARKIKDFIDEIPGGFLIYNADGNNEIVYANKALIKIFKCESLAEFKELTGNTFRGVVHPDDIAAVEKSIADQIALSPEYLDYVEYRIVRKDGAIRWVEDYGHFIHSESAGNFYYVFISDATEKVSRQMAEKYTLINDNIAKERKLQNLIEEYDKERKLIRQEHLQRLEVIEGLSINYESILYADLNENKVLPYRLSSRLERQFDKKLQVRELKWFLNDYVKVWVHPDDRAEVAQKTAPEYIVKMLETSKTYYLNYRCLQNDETQYIQLRIVNVSGGDKVSQIVMGYRNVDEEVLQEMRQKKLLEIALNNAKIADVAKNSFLSNMSHDMRTPLNAIFGYVALAKKNVEAGKSINSYLDKIETAGQNILELVDKVLELSYIETQDTTLNEECCNILDVMQEVYNSVSRLAEQKHITFGLHAESVCHAHAYVDKSKLQQILMHILNNAMKYTDTNGNVDFTVTERDTQSDDFATYEFSVADNGVGIAEEQLSRIFEPFERGCNTTQSGVFGAGLGLTIAKHLAETMGGSIEAQSELGKGSTFSVILSLRLESADDKTRDASEPEESIFGKKILIVEDNEINLEIETEILQDLGFETDCAENGKIAVEKIQAASDDEYALILMDIQMPIMDGRTAAKHIRNLDSAVKSKIPIIALSANAFESDRRESLEVGMNEHLTKPIDIDLLLNTIKSALGKA